MNDTIKSGFEQGSGVPPDALAYTFKAIAIGAILLVFAALVVQVIREYGAGDLESGEAISACVRSGVTAMLGVSFVLFF